MPPRLGELLVAAGTLTADEIEQALRAQVMWGGRLGTNLVELGYIDLDTLATALGKQHRMPAALGRHFDKSEPAVQAKLSADLAERFSCVPLLRAGVGRSQLIIATIEPLSDKAVELLAEELGVEPKAITQSIAAELRIRYHLERVYKIARSTRFLRPKGKTIPPFPVFEIDPLAFEDSQVDVPTTTVAVEPAVEAAPVEAVSESDASSETDLAIEEARGELRARLEASAAAKAATETLSSEHPTLQLAPVFADEDIQELEALAILDEDEAAIPEAVEPELSGGRERRRYVQTLDATPRTAAAAAADEAEYQASLGRISIKKVQITTFAAVDEPPAGTGLTLGEATRAIRRSLDRDRVAELVCETLFRFSMSCDAALLLVVRGDAAMSWKGFSRAGGSLPELAVPLDQPGLIPRVIDRCQTARSPSSDLGPIDQLLLVSLGAQSGDLVVVPVSIANQVMCVIAMATQPDAPPATAESIAAAAGAAFARLMRNASR